MLAKPDKAASVLRSLPVELQAPSLHPGYLLADVVRDPSLSPRFFVYEDGGECYYHAFYIGAVPGTEFIDVQSAYGYGGPVSSTTDREFLQGALAAWHAWCQESRILVEFIRFHPLLENWRFFSGEAVADRETVWVDLKLPDLLASYEVRARTAIRKATKQGLSVEWWAAERFHEAFQPLYCATMEGLKASSFYFFPPEYFDKLAQWDGVHYAVSLYEGKVVAAAIFLQGPDILEYHLSAADEVGKKFGATNLLLHEAGLYGQRAGCSRLHLGGGTNADTNNSLLFFKSGFSDQRASFKIGRKIHDPAAYLEMKSQWQAKTGRDSSRVMFYREN